jgi:hypothetical protein
MGVRKDYRVGASFKVPIAEEPLSDVSRQSMASSDISRQVSEVVEQQVQQAIAGQVQKTIRELLQGAHGPIEAKANADMADAAVSSASVADLVKIQKRLEALEEAKVAQAAKVEAVAGYLEGQAGQVREVILEYLEGQTGLLSTSPSKSSSDLVKKQAAADMELVSKLTSPRTHAADLAKTSRSSIARAADLAKIQEALDDLMTHAKHAQVREAIADYFEDQSESRSTSPSKCSAGLVGAQVKPTSYLPVAQQGTVVDAPQSARTPGHTRTPGVPIGGSAASTSFLPARDRSSVSCTPGLPLAHLQVRVVPPIAAAQPPHSDAQLSGASSVPLLTPSMPFHQPSARGSPLQRGARTVAAATVSCGLVSSASGSSPSSKAVMLSGSSLSAPGIGASVASSALAEAARAAGAVLTGSRPQSQPLASYGVRPADVHSGSVNRGSYSIPANSRTPVHNSASSPALHGSVLRQQCMPPIRL